MHDAVDTAAMNTHAGADGVDAVVEALDSHLGTLTGHTGYLLDGDKAVLNLRDLTLQQTLQEGGTCAGEDNLGVVVLVVNTLDDGQHRLTLAVDISGNLLALGQDELIVVVVNEQHLALRSGRPLRR